MAIDFTKIINTDKLVDTDLALQDTVKESVIDGPIYIDEGAKYSNIEIETNILQSKLDILDRAAGYSSITPVSPPKLDINEEDRFNTIEHLQPEMGAFSRAYSAVDSVLPDLVAEMFDRDIDSGVKDALVGLSKDTGGTRLFDSPDSITPGTDDSHIGKHYENLFNIGKVLVRQIDYFEKRRHRLENELRARTVELRGKRRELLELKRGINLERSSLDKLNDVRIERQGDYAVSQKLLQEDWQRVENEFLKRQAILQKIRGLYYVKQRSVSLSSSLPDPLELRFTSKDDIVPGCSSLEEISIPDDLEVFMDAVVEVPINHWQSLAGLRYNIPSRHWLEKAYSQRKFRLQDKRKTSTPKSQSKAYPRMFAMVTQLHSVMYDLAQQPLVFDASFRKTQKRGSEVLSLEDAMTGPKRLRRAAVEQKERLEQCVACLLETLEEIAPSLRLQWAQLAEDNRIVVQDATRWPGLERAEEADFNAVRTLVELINWWFKQINSKASGHTRTAMTNMIRGILIHAALGDPSEIIKGNVTIPPKRFTIGEYIRLKLNREARTGTKLQLLDHQHRYVGLLSVIDHDEQGTVANIVKVGKKDLQIDERFSVVANRRLMRGKV